ncbi:MAG: IS1 family transposase, partial [Ruminococcaceae bacterium]|nr:IS1 family transposase [Oscillospiraceae bacterium]
MSELKEVFAAYKKLSFTDRIVFYTTLSNTVNVHEDNIQDFLIETRICDGNTCIFCEGSHVVKNGKRKDGIQRFLCRDCKRSFIPSSCSVTSGTRKNLSVWAQYLKCMSDKKTLKETAEECSISVTTAFYWRHKILDALQEVTDRVCLDGTVEADETFFNVSYKGNHKNSRQFIMPRKAHKRG